MVHQLEKRGASAGETPWFRSTIVKAQKWSPPKEPMDAIRLDLNENQFVDPVLVEKALREIKSFNVHQYPDYYELVSTISSDGELPASSILPTNGADQAIEIVVRSLIKELDALLVVPSFSYYQHVLELEGISVNKIEYGVDLHFPIEAVLEGLNSDTSAVLLTSPSNPLTTEIGRLDLERILEKAKTTGTVVVVDEVYAGFAGANFADLLPKHENLVLIRSLSKFRGLASIRLGYIASSEKNIEQLSKIRGPWDVSGLASQMAIAVIKQKNWFHLAASLDENRRKLVDALTAIGARVVNSRVNFILFSHERAAALTSHLKAEGIIVALMTNYPDSNGLLKNHIRMAIPNTEQITRVITAVESFGND